MAELGSHGYCLKCEKKIEEAENGALVSICGECYLRPRKSELAIGDRQMNVMWYGVHCLPSHARYEAEKLIRLQSNAYMVTINEIWEINHHSTGSLPYRSFSIFANSAQKAAKLALEKAKEGTDRWLIVESVIREI